MTRRIIVRDPHPIGETIGSVAFGPVTFVLKRGLLATLDAARMAEPAMRDACRAILEVETIPVGADTERIVLAAVQVAWYEETQHRVPASCQRTLDRAKETVRQKRKHPDCVAGMCGINPCSNPGPCYITVTPVSLV